jgi:hypothetical protein
MSIGRAITVASAIALGAAALTAPSADAHTTRELVTSFGSFEPGVQKDGRPTFGLSGLAVDLETGNVYVADSATQSIDIFGPTGGPPADGVPSQIKDVPVIVEDDPSGVAIDNSCDEHQPRLTGKACEEYDPSYGDVYVDVQALHEYGLQKFRLNSAGYYELVGKIEYNEETSYGVAVDSHGSIYMPLRSDKGSYGSPGEVIEFRKVIEKIVNDGVEEFPEKLEKIILPQHIARGAGYVAVDSRNDVYVGSDGEDDSASEGFKGVAKLNVDAAGDVLSEEVFAGPIEDQAYRAIAVDSATGAVFVGDISDVAEYDSMGALQLTFGSTNPLGGSLGERANGLIAIAVNGPAELVYVANPPHNDVDVFGTVLAPPVVESQQPAASSVTGTSALIAGTANPESRQATYYFEYVAGEEYEPVVTDPYSDGGRTAIEPLSGGRTPQTVQRIALTGLRPGVIYHYRMVVTNAEQTTYGPDETFTTKSATPPLASTGPASEVGSTSATLGGVVQPRGLPTSYVFEIGTDTSYGGARLFGNAGSSTGEVPVIVGLQYLIPGTTYHYRLAATSFDGTGYGQDGTFTTPGIPVGIAQPASTPLIASPSVQFPSIAGAVMQPQGGANKSNKKRESAAEKVADALRACRKEGRGRRVSCEAQARRRYGRAGQSNQSMKR